MYIVHGNNWPPLNFYTYTGKTELIVRMECLQI